MKKTAFVVFAIVGCIVLGNWAFNQRRVHSQPYSSTYKFANGLTITPLQRQSNQVAELLDMQLWKFAVEVPDSNVSFMCNLELREKGKPAKIIGSYESSKFAVNKQTSDELSIGIYPLGQYLSQADRIKWRVGFEGQNSSMIVENPFENAISHGWDSHSLKGDGVFLMEASLPSPLESRQNPNMRTRDVQLFLTVKTAPYKKL